MKAVVDGGGELFFGLCTREDVTVVPGVEHRRLLGTFCGFPDVTGNIFGLTNDDDSSRAFDIEGYLDSEGHFIATYDYTCLNTCPEGYYDTRSNIFIF